MTIENAARLAELRREKGLSQEELAERLNVSRQAVSKWERGESSPDTDNLIALAQLYGISLDVLLGLQLAQTPDPAEAEYEAPGEEVEVEVLPAQELPPEPMPAADDPFDSYFDHIAREEARKAAQAQEEAQRAREEAQRAQEEAQARRRARRNRFPYPVFVAFAFLLLGFVFHWWHPGWMLFLTIPLYYLPERERTPLRLLGNPVMITIIYLLLGFVCGWWHPGWLIFLLIPVINAYAR